MIAPNEKSALHWGTYCVLVLFTLLIVGCGEKEPSAGKSKRTRVLFPVEVMPVQHSDVTYFIHAVGSVHPFENVRIISRVPGRVTAVHFQEGEQATTDRILVEIEPERYRLAVEAAKATLAKANAMLVDAEGAVARREKVNRDNPGLVREEDLQNAVARVASLTAERDLAKTQLAMAELDLQDAQVRPPFAGILQNRLVQTGQYVETGTLLATLQRRDPLLVKCHIPQHDAARMAVGNFLTFSTVNNEYKYRAKISHIGAGANPETRLVDISALVEDPAQDKLVPGSFARISVPITTVETIVAPVAAIRPSERGFLAYVAIVDGENQRVEERVLQIGLRTADGLVEVKSGLAVGEQLVVRGAAALYDQAQVSIKHFLVPAIPKNAEKPAAGTTIQQ